jgi:pyrimidine operon attenuation protein/uracil phosphoribosyltransferase
MTEVILNREETARAVTRIASEISERNLGCSNLVIIGIRSGGVPLAELIAAQIKRLEGVDVPLGNVDITLYRDDLSEISELPVVGETHLPDNIDGSGLILVDDVLFTGRTVRAAIDNIMDFGRPDSIQLAVLIDRGGRELPIQPDFVGVKIDVDPKNVLEVEFEGDCGCATVQTPEEMAKNKRK